MPFGIASGSEEYQRRQHEFLDGLNGVINIADDICVYGCGDTKEEADIDHDRNLRSKVAAIAGMPTPVDKAAVQRFPGMCQYLSKFCQNLYQTVLPLRDLTRDDTEFLWSDVHETTFNSAKTLVASITALRYYDVSLPVTL